MIREGVPGLEQGILQDQEPLKNFVSPGHVFALYTDGPGCDYYLMKVRENIHTSSIAHVIYLQGRRSLLATSMINAKIYRL